VFSSLIVLLNVSQVASPHNKPGARYAGSAWSSLGSLKETEELWLFGGYGYDDNGKGAYLDDVWRLQLYTNRG
jgi:hypothetical protein